MKHEVRESHVDQKRKGNQSNNKDRRMMTDVPGRSITHV